MAIYTYLNEGLFRSKKEKQRMEQIKQILSEVNDPNNNGNEIGADPAFYKKLKQRFSQFFDLLHFPPLFKSQHEWGDSIQQVSGIKDGYTYNFSLNYYKTEATMNRDYKTSELNKNIPFELYKDVYAFAGKTIHELEVYKDTIRFTYNGPAYMKKYHPEKDTDKLFDLLQKRYEDQVTIERQSVFTIRVTPKKK